MNLINNIEQRSEQWHNLRKGSIGGTRVKGIFAKNNLPLIDELIAERHAPVEETFVNEAMQRGIDLEPVAISEFEERTSYKVDAVGLVTNDKLPECHLSPDGLIMVNDNPIAGVEVKCPSTKKHVSYIRSNKLPAEYKYQVYHYFAMCDTIEKMFFVSFDPRFEVRPIHIIQVYRKDLESELKEYTEELKKFSEKLNKYESQIIDTF